MPALFSWSTRRPLYLLCWFDIPIVYLYMSNSFLCYYHIPSPSRWAHVGQRCGAILDEIPRTLNARLFIDCIRLARVSYCYSEFLCDDAHATVELQIKVSHWYWATITRASTDSTMGTPRHLQTLDPWHFLLPLQSSSFSCTGPSYRLSKQKQLRVPEYGPLNATAVFQLIGGGFFIPIYAWFLSSTSHKNQDV